MEAGPYRSNPSGEKAGPVIARERKGNSAEIELGINCLSEKYIALNEFFDLHMQIRTFAEATRENYLYMWNHFVREDLGRRSVTQIRKSDILKFYAKHKENGMANGTIHIFQKLLRPSFQLAVDDHIISENPADGCCKNYPEEDADRACIDRRTDGNIYGLSV